MNSIPLEKMEKLEEEYNIHLHIDQYPDHDEFYILYPSILSVKDNKQFVGYTIEEVEENLAG